MELKSYIFLVSLCLIVFPRETGNDTIYKLDKLISSDYNAARVADAIRLYPFVIFLENAAASNASGRLELLDNPINTGSSYLYTIEEDLLHQTWEEYEQPCLRQLIKVIRNVENATLWATWIWDSMQFPVGQLYGSRTHLGNYDQCMNFPWEDYPEHKTQYCLAELQLSELGPEVTNVDLHGSVQKYLQFKTKHNLKYNSLMWGICAPVICSSQSITKFAIAMFKSTHLGQMEDQLNFTVNSAFCHIAGEHEQAGVEEYILTLLVFFVVITSLLCTFYVSLEGSISKSIAMKFAKVFCITSNAKWLLKVEDHSVKSVLGIRLVSTYIIVISHVWVVKNKFGISNAGLLDKRLDNYFQCILFNSDMIVDTFFMMSGLLLAKALVENKSVTFNPVTVIGRRYIRLILSVLLTILILPIVLIRGDPAPLVKRYLLNEIDVCTKNWWKSVLMIGNYGDTENMCYPVLWSLACDFHCFVITVVIFWIFRKNRAAGIKTYVTCAIASIVVPVLHGYINNDLAVVSFDFRVTDDYRKYLIADPAYVNTHLRAGPYFLGIAVGYIMAIFHPSKHRNTMSKKSSIMAFFILLFLFVSLNILSGKYHVHQYGPLEGALFAVVRRNAFAALIGFFIIICEYGTLPVISDIVSWSGLAPLSKLSYGVYLLHFMLIFRLFSRTRVPLRSDLAEDIFTAFGVMTVAIIMSLFIFLFWEAPFFNLFQMFSKRSIDKTEANVKVEGNGKKMGELNKGVVEEFTNGKIDKKLN